MKYFDKIGPKADIFMESKHRYQTNIGGILTIFLVLLSSVFFVFFSLDIYQKITPISYVTTTVNLSPIISGKDVFYMVGIFIGGNDIKEMNRKFNYTNNFVDINRNGNPPVRRVITQMIPCSQSKKYEKWSAKFKPQLLSPENIYYCNSDDFEEDIIGSVASGSFSVNQFTLK